MIDIIRIGIRNLGRKKSRSVLTVMGIAIGVASVVLIASLGEIGKLSVNRELDSFAADAVMLSGNKKKPGSTLGEDHLRAVRESGVVSSAIPIVVEYTKSYMREHMLDVVVWGIDYGANQVISMDTLYGRLITKNDVAAGKRICIVDQNVAMAYYKRENIVGKTLSLQFASGAEEFTVVGVVSSGGSMLQGLMGNYIPSFIYVPYTTLQSLLGVDAFDQIAVGIKEGVDEDVAADRLLGIVEEVSGGGGEFKAENLQGQKDKLNNIMSIVTTVLSLIAGISLVVAGLSIMTVMLASVGERTREIGIKKSIGARSRSIMAEFLIEALAMSLTGSVIGVAAGFILIAAGCVVAGVPFTLNFRDIGFCVLFAVLVGVIFGVYPASLASRMSPVDALRRE